MILDDPPGAQFILEALESASRILGREDLNSAAKPLKQFSQNERKRRDGCFDLPGGTERDLCWNAVLQPPLRGQLFRRNDSRALNNRAFGSAPESAAEVSLWCS